jgi:hypothetical protein
MFEGRRTIYAWACFVSKVSSWNTFHLPKGLVAWRSSRPCSLVWSRRMLGTTTSGLPALRGRQSTVQRRRLLRFRQ